MKVSLFSVLSLPLFVLTIFTVGCDNSSDPKALPAVKPPAATTDTSNIGSRTPIEGVNENAKQTLMAVECNFPGRDSSVQTVYLETNFSKIVKGANFEVSGNKIIFETTPKDVDEEDSMIQNKKYKIGEASKFDSCSVNDTLFRIAGREQRMTYEMLSEIMPFQPSCIEGDLAFGTCSDQRVVYADAKEVAAERGQLLVAIYGYTGCAWCDRISRILNISPVGEPVRAQSVVVNITTARINRTGRVLTDALIAEAVAGNLDKANSGVPTVFIENPANGKIAVINPVDLEFGTDYHRDALIKYILDVSAELK